MACLDRVIEGFLDQCRYGHVGLWSLLSDFKGDCPDMGPDERRSAAMKIIREQLEEGNIVAGFPDREGRFHAWDMPTEEIVRNIETDWDKLDREPNLGDVVWFTTTEKGDRLVDKIVEEE